jgi:hypothetical protein
MCEAAQVGIKVCRRATGRLLLRRAHARTKSDRLSDSGIGAGDAMYVQRPCNDIGMTSSRAPRDKRLIETEAIIVAYAMSRLNDAFLARFRFRTWRSAFAVTGEMLGVAPTSMKNLRDEFDPLHGYRKGWHQRPLRPNRQRVLSQFCEVSDDALLEVVDGLLRRDADTRAEVAAPLAFATTRIANVAQRLRTGRLAEDYFLRHSKAICGIDPSHLIDRRQEAAGFDFASKASPEIAIEVKGLMKPKGEVLFTDLEWRTARVRGDSYWLVVVGCLEESPRARVWKNPCEQIQATVRAARSLTMTWRSTVSVA